MSYFTVIIKWACLLALLGDFKKVRSTPGTGIYTEEEARKFMVEYNDKLAEWLNRLSNAEWDYESNITEYNSQQQMKVNEEYSLFTEKMNNEIKKYNYEDFKDPLLKREFEFAQGGAGLSKEKQGQLDETEAKMSQIYSTTKLIEWQDPITKGKPSAKGNPKPKEPTISIEPDLYNIFSEDVKDSCKLLYYWEGWHSSVGRKEKPLFEEYVKLVNEAARLANRSDTSESWNADFEMDDFEGAVLKLYNQILPFYKQLHAYVRRKLSLVHNTKYHKLIQKDGCLPAHILGNLWAQEWQSIYKITAPYPKKKAFDVTTALKKQGYTPIKMFKLAEQFYISINMSAMTKTFWKKSIIEKPKDRDIVCHGSAWDFSNKDDFRIKMCTIVNDDYFKTIHHEMGHVEYYMMYKDQPQIFKQGANSGFHEAVGDTVALSVVTEKHLKEIGLLSKSYRSDKETEINNLYRMALEKVAFLPFAYVLDLWRWEIFRGNITAKEYNCRYWQLRQELQGIVPPTDRSVQDFDAGAKYHVIADVPYIRYFVSFIIQFQFHKALCIKAGQYDPKDPSKPLHKCDIYQSKEAGNHFAKMLRLGGSKPPQDAMEVLTGQREMDASALLEYFKPLIDWLKVENEKAKEKIGWTFNPKIDCSHKGEVKTTKEAQSVDKKCHYMFSEDKAKDGKKKQ